MSGYLLSKYILLLRWPANPFGKRQLRHICLSSTPIELTCFCLGEFMLARPSVASKHFLLCNFMLKVCQAGIYFSGASQREDEICMSILLTSPDKLAMMRFEPRTFVNALMIGLHKSAHTYTHNKCTQHRRA